MGEVYLAQDTTLDRKVAIKLLPAGSAASEEANKRLRREASTAAQLDHPNICSVYEAGHADGTSFIVMQYVEGETLDIRLKRKRLDLTESLSIATQVADGLAEAHNRGIIHRDVKPANIIITPRGQAIVMDFGLAKFSAAVSVAAEAETQPLLTTPGTMIGTVPYMSPEQVHGQPIDVRSDIFSFGVVFYEMLTGQQPFAAESGAATIAAILTKEPSSLRSFNSKYPDELQRITRKCLEKNRTLRYQNAAELRIDLDLLKRDAEAGHPSVTTKPETRTEGEAPPTGDKAVYAFLELFALAFTFEGAAALLRGETWWRVVGAWTVAIIFFVGGIQWPKIKLLLVRRFGSERRRVASDGVADASRPGTGVTFTSRYLIIPGVLVLLAICAAIFFHYSRATTVSPTEIKSLAILPFVNASGSADLEFLSDGVTDTLINNLSQLPQLSVKARSSVVRYKGKDIDPKQVAVELSVQAIVNGRVVQRGDDLTLYLSLVDGETGNQLWGTQYNRKTADLVAVQTEIARDISQRLSLRLTGSQEQLLIKPITQNNDAYLAYLRGQFYWNKGIAPGFEKSREYFQQAIDLDPTYALAYAGLAEYYAFASTVGLLPPNENWPKAEAAIKTALSLDDTLAEVYNPQAALKLYYNRDWPAAERAFQRGIELNPKFAEIHAHYAICLLLFGRSEEALAEVQRSLELEPLSPRFNYFKGRILFLMRQSDRAIDQFRQTLEIDPNFLLAHEDLAEVYAQKSMQPEAVAEWNKALTLRGANEQSKNLERTYASLGFEQAVRVMAQDQIVTLDERIKRGEYVGASAYVPAYTRLNDKDQVFAWLKKAIEEPSGFVFLIKIDPTYDKLRADPRFSDLFRR